MTANTRTHLISPFLSHSSHDILQLPTQNKMTLYLPSDSLISLLTVRLLPSYTQFIITKSLRRLQMAKKTTCSRVEKVYNVQQLLSKTV